MNPLTIKEIAPGMRVAYIPNLHATPAELGLEDAFGSHVRKTISVPYCEFGSHSLERDYFPETADNAD